MFYISTTLQLSIWRKDVAAPSSVSVPGENLKIAFGRKILFIFNNSLVCRPVIILQLAIPS